MNKWVTDNAMQLLHGQDICSPLIHSILSNSLQTIKVCIWKEQWNGKSTYSYSKEYGIILWSYQIGKSSKW